ncbi:MAG: apolipoprotein N-acyltransferase, partial [Kiritimatiellae bacterium]|nr:apolipoprotein N-acyltransferase [Kiritimatiellia bacterium]
AVSAAAALLADALAGVAVRARDGVLRVPGATRRHWDLSFALCVLLCAFAWGSARIRALRAADSSAPRALRVALVDPHLPCVFGRDDDEWTAGYRNLVLDTEASLPVGPDLVVWPETSLWSTMPDAKMEASLAQASADWGVPVLAGGTLAPEGGETVGTPIRNACWIFGPRGASEPYSKRHLVPFGEYIPLDDHVQALRRLAPAGVTCVPGDAPALFPVPLRAMPGETPAEADGAVPAALVAPLICFEDTVPQTAREAARGADVLVSISNDAWFDGSGEAARHDAEAAFRAIENGVPLVRCSNRGVSRVVSPAGESARQAEAGLLVETVPLPFRDRPTRWSRLGDAGFGWPCAAALLAVCLPPRRRGVHF